MQLEPHENAVISFTFYQDSQHSLKPGKSEKKLENLKNQGKPGKVREISWKTIALRKKLGNFFKHPFNLLIH